MDIMSTQKYLNQKSHLKNLVEKCKNVFGRKLPSIEESRKIATFTLNEIPWDTSFSFTIARLLEEYPGISNIKISYIDGSNSISWELWRPFAQINSMQLHNALLYANTAMQYVINRTSSQEKALQLLNSINELIQLSNDHPDTLQRTMQAIISIRPDLFFDIVLQQQRNLQNLQKKIQSLKKID
ncbi:MAG: hypothetical protein AB1391_02840 [Candidatus Micrarchaeota archaeon]